MRVKDVKRAWFQAAATGDRQDEFAASGSTTKPQKGPSSTDGTADIVHLP